MLSKNSALHTVNNTEKLQVSGNATLYSRPPITNIHDLCFSFLRNSLPALKGEALRKAEVNVKNFAQLLRDKMVQNSKFIISRKFKDPDVQSVLNDAVQASARKGRKANTCVLVDLITERASVSDSDFKDIVLSEAVRVVPKLTQDQIDYLSFNHYMTHCRKMGLKHVSQLEPTSKIVLKAVSKGCTLSGSQKTHMQFAGTCSIASLIKVDIYDEWINGLYQYLGYTDKAAFQSDVAQFSPSTYILLAAFAKGSELGRVNLTGVGQVIAIANLSRSLGRLDYSAWFK